MLRRGKEIYNAFQYSIERARALLDLQDGIDMLLKSNGDLISFAKKRSPEASTILDAIEMYWKLIGKLIEENLEKFVGAHEKQSQKLMKALEGFSSKKIQKSIEKAFKPLIVSLEATSMIHRDPLYFEAVVTSVTAFETYLRDTLVNLISLNYDVEERFFKELKELSYEKVKDYWYDWDYILGFVAVENISFYNLDQVNNAFRKAFGKKKDSLLIFKSKYQKKNLQNYLRLRHIIVHNQGKVDHKFIKETNSKYFIDEYYKIKEKYVKDMIGSMCKVVEKIEEEIYGHGKKRSR